jgi:arginine decarboxylase
MSDTLDIVWGRGDATTPLSAVDTALAAAGLHNYNLVTYSSVVPPDRSVVRPGRLTVDYGVGTPVGVVLAVNETTRTEPVAAGLGWIGADDGGVLMESTAASTEAVRTDLRAKLADARALRDWNWTDEEHFEIREHAVDGAAARDRAGAVVVAAVYGPLAYADDGRSAQSSPSA